MSELEFLNWSKRSKASYAADKMKANALTKAEAEKLADDDFKRLLPEGIKTKDHFLFTAKDESKSVVGFIWFCMKGAKDHQKAFIYDVIIEEPCRGRGFGKKIMLLAEEEIKRLGVKRIGLHVFGFNEIAIGLYKSLGYQTTDLVMEKSLTNNAASLLRGRN